MSAKIRLRFLFSILLVSAVSVVPREMSLCEFPGDFRAKDTLVLWLFLIKCSTVAKTSRGLIMYSMFWTKFAFACSKQIF